MQLDNIIMQGAAPIMARAFADTLDVKVEFGHQGAATDGKTIFLPPLGADRDRARILVRWFIGHEASHIKNTDMTCIGTGDPRLDLLINIVEDIRIEARQIARYPGYRSFISAGTEEIKDQLRRPDANDAWATVVAYLLSIGYRDVLGTKGAQERYKQAVEVATKMFGEPFIQLFKATIMSARTVHDTTGAVALAKRLLNVLDNPPPKPPEPPPPPQQQGKAGKGKGDKADKSQSGANPPDPQQGEPPQQGQPSPQQGQQPATSANGGKPDPTQQGQPGKAAGGMTPDQVANQLQQAPTEGYQCIGDTISQEINKEARTGTALEANQMNFTNGQKKRAPALLAEVNAVSTRARMRCKNQLLSVRLSERSYHQNGGRLSDKRVARIALADYRVFERIREGIDTHCAVQVLLDRSHSMQPHMALANRTALALANALQQIEGMSVSVAAFPSGEVVLPFGAKVAEYAGTITGVQAHGGTPMTEAILATVPALLAQKQPRKLMFIITDGEPSKREECEKAIAHIEKLGVECLGVGINTDITSLIPASKAVHDIKELPQAVFDALTAKARKR